MNKEISVPLRNGKFITIAAYELSPRHSDYEVSVCISDADGSIIQDICCVRQSFNERSQMFSANEVDCIVWSDSNSEDYTHKFVIPCVEEKEKAMYSYNFEIANKYNEVPFEKYEKNHLEKEAYVRNHLSDAVVYSSSGWDKAEYKLMSYKDDPSVTREFVVLYSNGHPERWICVDWNSTSAIMLAVAENLY